jgi:hypothetical protein
MMLESQLSKHWYNRFLFLLKRSDYLLSLVAIFWGWILVLYEGYSIDITFPVVLILASLFLLIPTSLPSIVTLQKISAFYLFCVPVNQISSQYLTIPQLSINFSYTLLIAGLCAAGYLIGKVIYKKEVVSDSANEKFWRNWLLMFVILILHMLLLAVLIKSFYGYGDERSFGALGQVCLYLLLFFLLWAKLKQWIFRLFIGIIVIIFSGFMFFIKG